MFCFKFIKPLLGDIEQGKFKERPDSAINHDSYYKWLGYAFERFCRQNTAFIAKILGFSAIKYQSGSYFTRRSRNDMPGCQIDLVFDRADHVLTVCEIRYLRSKVDLGIIEEMERNLSLLPNSNNRTIEKVFITTIGATYTLEAYPYSDRIITIDDLVNNA